MDRQFTAADFEDAVFVAEERIENNKKSMSYARSVWHEFTGNKIALGCFIVMALMLLMCIIGPMMNEFDYETNNYLALNQPPDGVHWFGTDALGRDLWTRVWYGGRISLLIAVMATIIPTLIGMVVGGLAGYYGGFIDTLIMRSIDVMMGIPNMVYLVLFTMVLGTGSVITMILVISLTGWMGSARMTRGLIRQIRDRDFVHASEMLGVSSGRLIIHHLIPNTLGITLANMLMSIPSAIYLEATLAYIGLGVLPPIPTWGVLVTDSVDQFRYYPHEFIIPCVIMTITLLCCHLMADGMRDALNPRNRK